MDTTERIRSLCKEQGISVTSLEEELGFSNGSLTKGAQIRSDRLMQVAKRLNVTMEYLLTGMESEKKSTDGTGWYFSDETARLAQQVHDDPNLRVLFDAAREVRPDDLKMAIDMLRRFKQTNPNG